MKAPTFQLMVFDTHGKTTRWDYVIAFTEEEKIELSREGYNPTNKDVREFYPPEQLALVGL